MKRLLAAALFTAAVLFSFSNTAAAQSTRTFSLGPGDTIAPASPGYDTSGTPIYLGGVVAGQVQGTTAGTFTLWVAFRSTGPVDEAAGVYSGAIVSPYSSFAVTQGSGRKSVTTSGTIDAGAVTYRLTTAGVAEIISVVSGNLTVWEGKGKRRTSVGYGTLDYGRTAGGSGTLALYF